MILPLTLSPQLRALLVEDSELNQKVMLAMLNGIGCEVTLAKNGREAVTIFADEQFDFVLMDVQMPILDGIGATQLIRQHECVTGGGHTPIIAVTAGFDRETCLEAGMDDHLPKPLKVDALVAAMLRASIPLPPRE